MVTSKRSAPADTSARKKIKTVSGPAKAAKVSVVKVSHSQPTPEVELRPASVKRKGKERAVPQEASRTGEKKSPRSNLHDASPSSTLPSSFKVITGSYEKLLYGLEGSTSATDSGYSFNLKPIFIFPAHMSCVRAVAASPHGGKWLASGSADEIVKVWDLRRRKEIGGLMHHEGSITHLEFPSRSHLLSASEDGTLCLFRARDWAVLRSLKGHKGRVNSVAVHPSGKVALSVGEDRTLRMWDLMRGKGSASTKLGKEGEIVRWSTDGGLFVVLCQSTIDLYSTDMKLLHSIIHPSRLHDIKFCKRVRGEGEILLVAAEDKKLSVYDLPSDRACIPTVAAEMIGHTNRVKAVDILSIALPPSNPSELQSTTIVSTISSDGKVHIYDLASLPTSSKEKTQIQPVAEYDTKGSRLTCLVLADGDAQRIGAMNGKRKRADEDTVGGGDSDEDDAWDSQQGEEGEIESSDGEEDDED
ncbi:WD40-repeat-containing domain protein [Amylocystis lapponica]|nr:WD40-repeat-containing domain protein [Amylocystis lapponica]